MSFDPASLLSVSHLATFLGGTVVGAAGKYMADRFTDSRRKKEAAAEARRRYSAIHDSMPSFIAGLKADLSRSDNKLIREFVVLPNERITFNHDRPRFEYYETEHPDLPNMVQMLLDASYIRDISTTRHPIYRLSEEFVTFLNET